MYQKKTYKKRLPSRVSRGRFSPKSIVEILERDGHACFICYGEPDDIHHCKYKSNGGRGVTSNGVAICRGCHDDAHSDGKVRKYLEDQMIEMYGIYYYMDEYDLIELEGRIY